MTVRHIVVGITQETVDKMISGGIALPEAYIIDGKPLLVGTHVEGAATRQDVRATMEHARAQHCGLVMVQVSRAQVPALVQVGEDSEGLYERHRELAVDVMVGPESTVRIHYVHANVAALCRARNIITPAEAADGGRVKTGESPRAIAGARVGRNQEKKDVIV